MKIKESEKLYRHTMVCDQDIDGYLMTDYIMVQK
jgi:hypothetical protein